MAKQLIAQQQVVAPEIYSLHGCVCVYDTAALVLVLYGKISVVVVVLFNSS